MTQPNGWTGLEVNALQDMREEERRRWAIAVAASLISAVLAAPDTSHVLTAADLVGLAEAIEEYVRGK